MPIPSELLEYKQWVLWRRAEVNDQIAKLPISPWSGKVASCDKPQTWSTYRHVCYARRKFRSDGIRFVFTPSDPFYGIDLDRCRALNGKVEPEAQTVIERLASYTELSPSGTGIHVLIKAKLGGPGQRSGRIEIYDPGKYFTVTGQQVPQNGGSVENRQAQLDGLISEIFTRDEIAPCATNSATLFASDEELIERAKTAKNGGMFRRLWAGDVSDFGGDHSRADLALCRMLTFWCKGDLDRVDQLFRQSGLMREKWDRPCGAMPYGERTIAALSFPGA